MTNLSDQFELVVTLTQKLSLLESFANNNVLLEEGVTVVIEPVDHLPHILLKEAQRQALVQLYLALVPHLAQFAMVSKNLNKQHVSTNYKIIILTIRGNKLKMQNRTSCTRSRT